MNNVVTVDGHKTVISFDPEIDMFRGEFVGLNGGADFYADDVSALRHEGERSLKIFLEECAARRVEPQKWRR